MKLIFAPGFGASTRSFYQYENVFKDDFVKLDFSEAITLQDHYRIIENAINKTISQGEDYFLAGHSMGAPLITHYIDEKRPEKLRGVILIGGGEKFYPAKGMNWIMERSPLVAFLLLTTMVLVSPLMYILLGWKGTMQRLEAVKLAKHMGIKKILDIYNKTILYLEEPPKGPPIKKPALLLRLPKDVLLPEEAINNIKKFYPNLTEKLIPTEHYHFTHNFDIYVAGVIYQWLKNRFGITKYTLPDDTAFALKDPKTTFEASEGFQVSRLYVITFIAILLIWKKFVRSKIQGFAIQSIYIVTPENGFSNRELLLLLVYVLIPTLIIIDAVLYPKIPKTTELIIPKEKIPMVSIILPVRNEERNIERILNSLFSIYYPKYEIIIIDGSPNDKTIRKAEITIKNNNIKRIPTKLLKEPHKPEEWMGKSWACWNAAQKAKGELLLFTDADTVHTSWSLVSTVNQLYIKNLDMLSVLGKFELLTFWERVIMPFINLLMFAVMGGRLTNHKKWPLTLAIGQYILMKTSFYFEIGGHKAVKSKVSEDVGLAKLGKKYGKYAVFKGTHIYKVRMYTSLKEIFFGIGKNVYDGLGNHVLLGIGAAVGFFVWIVMPFIMFPIFGLNYGWTSEPTRWLVFGMLFLMAMIIPNMLESDVPLYYIIFFPLGVTVFLGILIWSLYIGATNKPFKWKGRIYRYKMENKRGKDKTQKLEEPIKIIQRKTINK